MKRIIFLVVMTFVLTNVQAQEVYLSIRQKAAAVVSNPQTVPLLKDLNQFKVDALDYLSIKMKEEMPDSSATFLDKEAYALHNFLNLYMRTVLENRNQPKAYQIKIVKLFMDASYSNPLFNDPEKQLTMAYFSDGESMTRFVLDTDWRLAYLAASTELKKMK